MLDKTLFAEKWTVVDAAAPANPTFLGQFSGHRQQHLVPRNTMQRLYSADMLDQMTNLISHSGRTVVASLAFT